MYYVTTTSKFFKAAYSW